MSRGAADTSVCATLICLAALLALPAFAAPTLREIRIEPKSFTLAEPGATQTVIVTGVYDDGSIRDLTSEATLSAQGASIEPGAGGVIKAKSPGAAKLDAKFGTFSAEADAQVEPGGKRRPFSFDGDIAPIFSKNGCNNSSCHGSLKGQAGFKLSVFGYDPEADYKAITQASDGRRVNLQDPEKSLILMKPTFQVKHGGGLRFKKDSPEYAALTDWLYHGAARGVKAPKLLELKVFPAQEVFLTGAEQKQQLVVTGRYENGVQKDLTRQVNYSSNDDDVIGVDGSGLVSVKKSGETAVMIRLLGTMAVARVAVTLRPEIAGFQKPKSQTFVDDYTFDKMARLRIEPSELSSDSEFLRRIYLDLTGTTPTSEQTRSFLSDRSPDKRSRVVDELFKQPEYADFWALKFGDLLANTPETLFNATGYFQLWIRKAFAENMPYDQFTHELITSLGDRYGINGGNYYATYRDELDRAAETASVFMGVSMECARCHDHPREKWKRTDFLGLAAFFPQVTVKTSTRINEYITYLDQTKELHHPDDPKVIVPAKFPGEEQPLKFEPGEDRRERLAAWLTSPNNAYFAPAIVNRIWKQFMGRGIIDPEDIRITNPATHPELLKKLSDDFIASGYDLRHLMKTIVNSRTYQLSSRVNDSNKDDTTEYSHYYTRHLTAEQMLDAIDQSTGTIERFPAMPPGKRAIQLPDEKFESYFLATFNRPPRDTNTCTRKSMPNVTQALNLVNGDTLNQKIKDERGTLAKLLKENKSDKQIVDELVLTAVARTPTEEEQKWARDTVKAAASRKAGLEDFLWALLNTKEFQFNH